MVQAVRRSRQKKKAEQKELQQQLKSQAKRLEELEKCVAELSQKTHNGKKRRKDTAKHEKNAKKKTDGAGPSSSK